MPLATTYGELEIGLHRVQRGAHEVVLRLTDPQSQAEVAPVRGPAAIDAEALLAAQTAPEAYGRLLAAQVFADPAVRGLYGTARAALERGGVMLRVRLAIDPGALELHDLRWELLRFSPRGTHVLTTLSDRTARLWPADGAGEAVVIGEHDGAIQMAAFSSDGDRVATASEDRTVRIWPTGGGEPVVLTGHDDAVESVAFSVDGTRVVTAGRDHTVRIWQADGQGTPLVLSGHTDAVRWATFSRDGLRVLTASADRTVRLWTLYTPDELVRYLWHATTYCLRGTQRITRLGATRTEAAASAEACMERVSTFAAEGAYR